MDDFEYSVTISDRDWECFFQECEECDLLPPALAGVDDSGMSDIDDMGPILADSVLKVDITADFLAAGRPINGPPDCEGSPVEHYLSKYGVGGMESVLSGSEEDIHLMSVNTFFERLRGLTEDEKVIDPSQVGVGKTREAEQGEELCSDGPQASNSALPKNIPKLNSLPARSETAIGKETTETVNANSNIKTMKKHEHDSQISPGVAVSNSLIESSKSTHPETDFREEACVEMTANELRKQSQSESPDVVVCSETTHDSDKMPSSDTDTCKLLDDLLTGQAALNKTPNIESRSKLEGMAEVKSEEDKTLYVLSPDSDPKGPTKRASQELSPCPSNKKKRRRKKRISTEPIESGHGDERQFLACRSDLEEEPCAWKRGMDPCSSGDHLSYMNKSIMTGCSIAPLPMYLDVFQKTATSKVSHLFPSTNPSDMNLPESLVRHGRCKTPDSAKNNTTNDRSVPPSGQTDDSVTSTPINGGNVATHLQPCSKMQLQESTGLNTCPGLPVSITVQSDLATEIGNCDRLSPCEREAVHAGSLQQSDIMNHSLTNKSNEFGRNPKSCTAEVISITQSVESNYPALEASQNDKVSTTKSGLAVAVGNSGKDNHALCQTEAEPPQQLEIDCQDTAKYSSTCDKTNFPLSTIVMIGSDAQELPAHEAKPQQFITGPCSCYDEEPSQVAGAKLTSETSNASPDNDYRSKSPANVDVNNTIQQTKYSQEVKQREENTISKRAELAVPHVMVVPSENPLQSGELNYALTGNSPIEMNPKSPMSEDLLKRQSNITAKGSCSTLEGTQSCRAPSNEEPVINFTDMLENSTSPNTCRGQEIKIPQILATDEKGKNIPEPKSLDLSQDPTEIKCDLDGATNDAEAEKAPDSKHSVYAMSSFWSEIEKLTIRDILCSRMVGAATPPSPERETADASDATDSGYFTQLEESKPNRSGEDTSGIPDFAESNSDAVLSVHPPFSVGVMWESEPDPVSLGAGLHPESMMLTSAGDVPQPLLSGGSSAQKYLRKISKNVSVYNLPALDRFTDGHMPRQDSGTDSSPSSSLTDKASTDSYRVSLTGIFQYLFGGKQSNPNSSASSDDVATYCIEGNSVPETYDHFFSEFDAGSFFYPLIETADQTKDELVPIFSCSRSTNQSLQFPEAYDHFFSSSSSDDSSMESDEEDAEDRGPIRVVTRFSRQSSQSQISSDIYENFFTDGDLKQNFFWKNTFSLRNIRLFGSMSQNQRSNSFGFEPVEQNRPLRKTIQPLNALGCQDVPFPDPLLYHLEDRISTLLAERPFRYEELQTATSNPRLGASLVPLRQSANQTMCLVCIAFASWVLKSANPQVGDAWKAVLLANVSALSAIRYLRRYVRVEEAVREEALHHTTLSEASSVSPHGSVPL